MQTFLPYPDFAASAAALDYKRLGKQRVECLQILNALRAGDGAGANAGWRNHPATRMWRGHEWHLCRYMHAMIQEWTSRGYHNTMVVPWNGATMNEIGHVAPRWLGDPDFHESHRSNLMRKDPVFYAAFAAQNTRSGLEYVWPVAA